MDNTAKGFAQKIISELEGIKRLIHDALSFNREKNESANKQYGQTDNNKNPPSARVDGPPPQSDPPITERSRPDAPRNKSYPWLRQQKPLIEAIGVVVLVIYTGVTIALWWSSMEANRINRNIFNASQRPYVGLNGIGVTYIGNNAKGALFTAERPTSETNRMAIRAEIKNFGTIPALNTQNEWRIFVNGVAEPMTKIPDTPAAIFPGQIMFLTGNIGRNDYSSIQDGEKTLEIEVIISYSWPAGSSGPECTRHRYAPANSAFLGLGACIKR